MKKNKDTIGKLREKNKRLRADLAKKKAVSKDCPLSFFVCKIRLMFKAIICTIAYIVYTLVYTVTLLL